MRLANLLFMTVQRQHIIHVLNLHGHTRCLHPMRFRQNPRVLTTDKTWLQQKHQLEGLNSKTRTLNLARNLPCNDPARQEPSGILPGTFDETSQPESLWSVLPRLASRQSSFLCCSRGFGCEGHICQQRGYIAVLELGQREQLQGGDHQGVH